MQRGWRLYAVMFGSAAMTGIVIALALSGGPRFPATTTPRPVALASTSTTATPTSSPISATPSPSPSRTPSDPLARVRVLTTSWRPSDTTAIVERDTGSGTRLIAVPLNGGTSLPLVDLPSGTQWHIRLDGSALALTLDVGTTVQPRTRIAYCSFLTGLTNWVAPDEPTLQQRGPRWSNDGTVVYYGRSSLDGQTDQGVYRVRVDGTNLTQLRAPSADRPVDVVGLSPDGLTLVLSKVQAGGSVDLFDLSTRVTRGGPSGGRFESWRPNRPRALVSAGTPTAGRTSLVLWDDLAAANTTTPLVTQSLVFGADWDPDATRIVTAAALGIAGNTQSQLITMDSAGQNRVTLPGTVGASSPYWLRAGIVYLWTAGTAAPGSAPSTEVRVAQPTGTAAPKTLYSDTNLIRLTYVSP